MNGGSGFLLLIIAFGFLYFVLVRPQKRRQAETRRMLTTLKPGDEVVTAGGIYGTVTELVDDETVLVEIAPELRVRVARRAIGAVIPKDDYGAEEAPEPPQAPDTPKAQNGG
jgi:preprotein translocase subunit YajC